MDRHCGTLSFASTSGTCFDILTGSQVPLTVDDSPARRPYRWSAFPNPSMGPVRFRADGPLTGPSSLCIFDASGRLIRRLSSDRAGSGPQEIRWDGRNESGAEAAAGVYFYRSTNRDAVTTDKLVVAR